MSGIPAANIQTPSATLQAPGFTPPTVNALSDKIKFGNSGPTDTFSANASQPPKRLGMIKAGKILWTHLQHADNREEIKAMSQYFLPRTAKFGTALIPFGFLLAGPVDWWAGKHIEQGRQKIDALIAAGKLNPENGPLGCIMQIEKNWQLALGKAGQQISDEDAAKALNNIRRNWNQAMDHLFPDDTDGISLVREKLKLHPESRMFHMVGRAFHANRNSTVRFFKNASRKVSNNMILSVVMKPIRWLMLGLGLAYQGLLMLDNGPAVKKLLAQTVKRIV
ncbi:MAG TPA: hypothetical protein V6C99_03230 [Oculatellaceae cyanobacterium]|jgi:hypothetical protein